MSNERRVTPAPRNFFGELVDPQLPDDDMDRNGIGNPMEIWPDWPAPKPRIGQDRYFPFREHFNSLPYDPATKQNAIPISEGILRIEFPPSLLPLNGKRPILDPLPTRARPEGEAPPPPDPRGHFSRRPPPDENENCEETYDAIQNIICDEELHEELGLVRVVPPQCEIWPLWARSWEFNTPMEWPPCVTLPFKEGLATPSYFPNDLLESDAGNEEERDTAGDEHLDQDAAVPTASSTQGTGVEGASGVRMISAVDTLSILNTDDINFLNAASTAVLSIHGCDGRMAPVLDTPDRLCCEETMDLTPEANKDKSFGEMGECPSNNVYHTFVSPPDLSRKSFDGKPLAYMASIERNDDDERIQRFLSDLNLVKTGKLTRKADRLVFTDLTFVVCQPNSNLQIALEKRASKLAYDRAAKFRKKSSVNEPHLDPVWSDNDLYRVYDDNGGGNPVDHHPRAAAAAAAAVAANQP